MFIIFVAVWLLSALAEEMKINLNEFRKLDVSTVCAENFNSGKENWNLGKNGFSIASGGVMGTKALYAQCKSGNLQPAQLKIKVKPGAVYNISFQFRTKDFKVKDAKRMSVIFGGIQTFDSDGKSLKGQNFWGSAANIGEDWKTYKGSVTIPANAVEDAILRIDFDWWHTGEIWIDEILLEGTGTTATIFPAAPSNLALDDAGRISLRAWFVNAPMSADELALQVTVNERTKLLNPDDKLLFSGEFGNFETPVVSVNAKLLNLKEKLIVAEHSYQLSRTPVLSRGVRVEADGRTLVDGKPFLPIGTFTYQQMMDEDYKRLQEAGFNFVSFGICFRDQNGVSSNSPEKMHRLLDMLKQYDLKAVIQFVLMVPQKEQIRQRLEPSFGSAAAPAEIMKLVGKTLGGNPSLLAYYISDENPRGELPDLQHNREHLAAVDPNHPALTLTNNRNDLPFYAASGDILVYDIYPFGSQSGVGQSPDTLEQADKDFSAIVALGIPFWLCTQGFDWAVHRKKSDEKMPTEKELTALPLLGAIYGAKGFYYYSYHEVFHKGNAVDPEHSKKMWPRIAASSKLLKELSPFILGCTQLPPLTIIEEKAIVRGKALQNDVGGMAVLLVATTPASTSAKVILPADREFVSKYGRTVKQDDGSWLFNSDGVDFDILYGR